MKPHILYLCHCAPTLPDKGERIRAYHEVQYLAQRYNVHVAGFAREDRPLAAIPEVKAICASLHLERLSNIDLPRKGLRFLFGESLTTSYYQSNSLHSYVRALSREVHLSATVVFTSVMASYAPEGVPILLDMVDVDSEKWAAYALLRSPGWFFSLEADRLRRNERKISGLAKSVILTTEQESALLRRIVPECRVRAVENGVDFKSFDPTNCPTLTELAGRRYIVMVGAMAYYPNSDGAVWFAKEVFPGIRAKVPDLEFLIVGHKPPAAVKALGSLPGVVVTGYVPDVRPYIKQSVAAVTPLRIARGVQNKVLESLAMGKEVLATPEIAKTFGAVQPVGLRTCLTVDDYCRGVVENLSRNEMFDPEIRNPNCARFSWDSKLDAFDEELRNVIASGK